MLNSYKMPRETETADIDLNVQKAEFWKEGYQKGFDQAKKEHYALLLKAFLALNNNTIHKQVCDDIAKQLDWTMAE